MQGDSESKWFKAEVKETVRRVSLSVSLGLGGTQTVRYAAALPKTLQKRPG